MMSYSLYKLGESGTFIEVNDPILSRIDDFINKSGKVVYDYYEDQREKNNKFFSGGATLLKPSLILELKDFIKQLSNEYIIHDNFFQYYKAVECLFSDIIEESSSPNENHIVITQTPNFKKEWNYDGTAITFEIIEKRLIQLYKNFEIKKGTPNIFCLVLDHIPKIEINWNHIISNKKKHIELTLND